MRKRIAIFFSLAVLVSMFSVAASAQNVWVKGICKDELGKPIRAATVEFKDLVSGSKTQIITGERGEYQTVDLRPGIYKVSLIDRDRKVLFFFDHTELQPNSQSDIDFDMAKLRAEAGGQTGAAEQQHTADPDKSAGQ
jgi:hypothetical protein